MNTTSPRADDPINDLLEALDQFPPYVVDIKDWKGSRKIACWSEDDAWEAIGTKIFGGLHQVYSPIGLDVQQFIPY